MDRRGEHAGGGALSREGGLVRLPRLLSSALGSLGDLLLPPSCALCAELLDRGDTPICRRCLEGFEPLRPPLCPRCGQPFAAGAGPCPDCEKDQPVIETIRSALLLGGTVEEAIISLKLGGKTWLAPFLAGYIVAADLGGLDLRQQDLLVPVPLHRARLYRRGFNQSALMARRLSVALGIPADLDHLLRHRPTPAQSFMKARSQRRENVRQAFSTTSRHPFAGKRICLVDDVVTTGSTLESCARTLLQAGARAVVAVTVARTPQM